MDRLLNDYNNAMNDLLTLRENSTNLEIIEELNALIQDLEEEYESNKEILEEDRRQIDDHIDTQEWNKMLGKRPESPRDRRYSLSEGEQSE